MHPTSDAPSKPAPGDEARFPFLFPYFHGLTRFARRLIPLVISLSLVGIAWFEWGVGYNIPALFWYEGVFYPMVAGFSVTLLLGHLWLVTYLIDTRNQGEYVHRSARGKSRINLWLVSWVIPPARQEHDDEYWYGLRWYLSVTWLPLLIVLALGAFVDLYPDPREKGSGWFVLLERWPFLAGMAVALLLTHLVIRILHSFLYKFLHPRDSSQPTARVARNEERWLQTIAILVFLLAFSIYLVCAFVNPYALPPVFSVCLLFALIVGVSGAIFFHFRQYALVWLVFLFLWLVLANSYPYKVRVPGLEPEYQNLVSLREMEEPDAVIANKEEHERVWRLYTRLHQDLYPQKPLPPDDLTSEELLTEYHDLTREVLKVEERKLDDWRRMVTVGQPDRKPRLAVIAVSGGANRSSLWTSVVLSRLEDKLRGSEVAPFSAFPRHVRVITGASGGMVGASHYVVRLTERGQPTPFNPADVAEDCLTPVINRLVFRDTPLLFWPVCHYQEDRGRALDEAFEKITPQLKEPFSTLAPGEEAGWRPSLIFSPMLIEDGRRLLISNLRLHYMTASEGGFLLKDTPEGATSPPESSGDPRQSVLPPGKYRKQLRGQADDRYSQSAVEFFRLFPDSRNRFKISTAARLNATFPYISPAVQLPTDPPRRVVDAGYYDNYGVSVAASWIYHHREWIEENTSGVVLIQIRDGLGQTRRRHLYNPQDEPSSMLGRGWSNSMQWLTGPPAGALAARESVMSFRNDEWIQGLSDYFDQNVDRWFSDPDTDRAFFTTVVFELPRDLGFNWYLTRGDKDSILQVFDDDEKQPPGSRDTPNRDALEKLAWWWNDGF